MARRLLCSEAGASVRFWLGQVVATPAALSAMYKAKQGVDELLARHQSGDWGEVGNEDWDENELSLREGYRLFTVYRLVSGERVWIITEADRSATTMLLPEDY